MRKKSIFLSAVVLYLAGILVFAVHTYTSNRRDLRNQSYLFLETAARMAQPAVGIDFHTRIFQGRSVFPSQVYQNTLALTEIKNHNQIDQIFTVIPREDGFSYTSSSANREELLTDTYTRYGEPYPGDTAVLREVLETGKERVLVKTLDEKRYKYLYLPLEGRGGNSFVLVSRLDQKEYAQANRSILTEGILLVLYLLAITLPLLILYIQANRKEKRQLLDRIYRDQMTGLPNRNRLRIDAEKTGHPILFLMNIDSFKEYNDFYGFKVGDFIILEMASRLRLLLKYSPAEVKDSAVLYKMQVDEYALLLNTPLPRRTIEETAARMAQAVNEDPFIYHKQEIPVNATLGIAQGREGATPLHTQDRTPNILARADMALKKAKISRSQYLIYDESMHIRKEYESNIRWTQELKSSIRNDRVVPFFQPIIDNRTGEIAKYETLIRIRNQEETVIYPSSFLHISKKSRLYPQLTRIMIRHAMESLRTHPDKSFSLNFSVDDILNRETSTFFFQMLRAYPKEASRLVIEIVESEGIENFEEVKEFIAEVKNQGCRIAIDDFGTGYSNFSYLVKLHVDFIKIDASMIKNIHQDPNAYIITETIVGFCKKMNIQTIAEFVHNKEVHDIVKSLDIDYSQGFYLGKPSETL